MFITQFINYNNRSNVSDGYESVLDGIDDEFGGVVDAEFAEDVCLKGIYRLCAVAQTGGYLLVLESFARQTYDIEFPRCEDFAADVLRRMHALSI